MRTRRGALIDLTTKFRSVDFQPGDIVVSAIVSCDFTGVVDHVDRTTGKVYVAWGGNQAMSQHDPDEIRVSPYQDKITRDRMQLSRRGQMTEASVKELVGEDEPIPGGGEQYVGDPKTHGIDEPRGGGFSIMQQLQDDLRKEEKHEGTDPKVAAVRLPADEARRLESTAKSVAQDHFKRNAKDDAVRMAYDYSERYAWDDIPPSYVIQLYYETYMEEMARLCSSAKKERVAKSRDASVDLDSLKSRRAMYWGGPGRTYRLTRQEQQDGVSICPRCKKEMQQESFTKSEKLVLCPECGFKIPTSKVVTENPRVEVEIEQNGDVEVTVASLRSRRGVE